MEYTYYPGCSLESSARGYDESIQFVFRTLGHGLHEIEDWNCCGATSYMATKETISLVISARNLAIAEKSGNDLCPYGAISFDEDAYISKVNSALCKGCGTCVASCPCSAASAQHFTDKQIFAEIEGILK